MEQSDKPLFVFYIVRQLARYPTQVLSSNKAIYKLAWAFPYPSNKLHHDAHPVQLYLQLQMQITLVVDPLYCKNSASQKSVFLLCLLNLIKILRSQLSLIFLHSSKDLNLFFHFYPFPCFFNSKSYPPSQLLTYHQPGKVLPSEIIIKLCVCMQQLLGTYV